MTTFEPWAVENMPPNTESHSEPAATLDAGIESLTTAKDAIETIPIRAIFESAIGILGFVRVRVLRSVHLPILISG